MPPLQIFVSILQNLLFWLGLLDLQTGHLDFCNAGHNPPVIGGGANHGDFLKMLSNAPIGLFPGLEYEGEVIETLAADVAAHRQGAEPNDDLTMMCLRVS